MYLCNNILKNNTNGLLNGCTTNCIYQKKFINLMLLNYPTVETVGNVEEDNLVKNHSQRFQPLELEAKII
ncbi:MAG TPA: hypothetical protein DCM02_05140 [Flavobacterium sp.]|nr:hypothetical protein [Flavobacterium sp.]